MARSQLLQLLLCALFLALAIGAPARIREYSLTCHTQFQALTSTHCCSSQRRRPTLRMSRRLTRPRRSRRSCTGRTSGCGLLRGGGTRESRAAPTDQSRPQLHCFPALLMPEPCTTCSCLPNRCLQVHDVVAVHVHVGLPVHDVVVSRILWRLSPRVLEPAMLHRCLAPQLFCSEFARPKVLRP